MPIFNNPVVRGTEPDPSVTRVGEDFYLATSSFDLMPGVLIRHSTDLVNWTILAGAISRPAQYRRDGREGPIMLFAPTLRCVDGVFYLACTNVAEGGGNFIVRAEDPSGPWSDALWVDDEAFDPSLLYDDGRWYYTRRSMRPREDGFLGPVVQAELDITTGELGPFRELTTNYGGFQSNDIEGPHLYRIGDWYYLFSAEGGTWKGHMQTCARSRSPWGPFEPAPHNPVLTHRHRVGHPIQSTGHADLIDDENGNWWAVFLGTRHESAGGFAVHHNLGRETFLAPVSWTADGWPVIGRDGTVELIQEHSAPLPAPATPRPTSAPTSWIEYGWKTVGPSPDGISATEASVTLPRGPALGEPRQGALLLAQTEDSQTFEATLASADFDGAGVGVYSDDAHFFRLTLRRGRDSTIETTFARRVDDMHTVDHRVLPHADSITLRIVATADYYRFEAVPGGQAPVAIGQGRARLLSAEAAEWFVGVHFAVLAEGSGDVVHFRGVRRTSETR
ncbi:glycoside hydrolase family 43 protein [Agromyces sp. GXS1127]|uniref:glycoside hydrolase family 43 protein n=1 Tax=Agromyces sp. GXS1127 TaxID=3424181 RepID=UPI003D31B257